MRTNESVEIMAISERNQSEEPKIVCVIRDFTNHDNCAPRPVNLPASYTILDLLQYICKDYGYQIDSFKLLYERNASQNEEVGNKELKLGDVISMENKKHKFHITNIEDGVAPIKVQSEVKNSGSLQFDELAIGESESQSRDADNTTSNLYNSGGIPGYSSSTNRYGGGIQPTTSSYDLVTQEATGFCGLVNQAMTCYLNSLLQTLFMTPEFRNALYSWKFNDDDSNRGGAGEKCIPYQLQRLFLQMQTSNQRSVETTPVTRSFGWDSSHSWQQHDVQELCRVMFDALEINWKDTQQANLINELYQGKLKDYVKCLECKNESFRTDAYLDIPLVIKPFGAPRAFRSVEEALQSFVNPEILDGNNQYQCDNCNKKCDAHKGLKFESFPYLLTLQLKRFDFDYDTMARIKLNDRMTFPNILDLNSLIDDTMPATPGVNDHPSGGFPSMYNEMSVDGDTAAAFDQYAGDDALDDFVNDAEAQQLIADRGEYVYELFSIMIHSGSAVGGHYYAYIKCFSDNEWYSFNDQSVTRITKDDIRKTYGGTSSRGLYSTTYTSSTNAYMLMYRKVDPCRNKNFMGVDQFPDHILQLQEHMQRQSEESKIARELEKSMCKIKTYCFPPSADGTGVKTTAKLESKTLEIHKDISVIDATTEALKLFELDGVVPLERCRLVKYDHYTDSIEKSFDNEAMSMCEALCGSNKTIYAMKLSDLYLEIKDDSTKPWQKYKFGGTTYKVHPLSLNENLVYPALSVRAEAEDTVHELKRKIVDVLNIPSDISPEKLRCATERYGSDPQELTYDDILLRNAGCSKGTKIYVDTSEEPHDDADGTFEMSNMRKLIEIHLNTIRIYITIPSTSEVVKFMQKERDRKPIPEPSYGEDNTDAGFDEIYNRHQTGTSPKKTTIKRHTPVTGDSEQQNSTVDNPPPYEEAIAACTKCHSDSNTCVCGVNASNSAGGDTHTGNGDVTTINNDSNTDTTVIKKTVAFDVESGDVTGKGDNANTKTDDVTNNCVHSDGTNLIDDSTEDDDGIPLGASADNVFIEDASHQSGQSSTGHMVSPSAPSPSTSPMVSPSSVEKTNEKPSTSNSHRDDEVWDYSGTENNAVSTENQNQGQEMDTMTSSDDVYFREESEEDNDNKTKVLRVCVDKRITLKRLKHIIQKKLDVPINCFKMYKVYSNNQEFECSSATDTLSSMMDESKMSAKLGRVLRKGEYKIKIYELELNPSNPSEPYLLLFDLVVSKGMTVAQAKEHISEELQSEHERTVSPQRIRLRKKTWKNPGIVYNNSQKVEDDIPMYSNSEMFIQIIDEPDRDYLPEEMHIFIQHWKPSLHEFSKMSEIVVPSSADVNKLKDEISAVSELPTDRIEIAKSRGTFPGDVSVLDAHTTGLDWNPSACYLTSWPVYLDSGSIICYRDKDEMLGTLTAEKRKEISLREASTHHRPASSMYSRKEKALKIYTHNDIVPNTNTSSRDDRGGASNYQANDLD